MLPLYRRLVEKFKWTPDEKLIEKMKNENENKLIELEEDIKKAQVKIIIFFFFFKF